MAKATDKVCLNSQDKQCSGEIVSPVNQLEENHSRTGAESLRLKFEEQGNFGGQIEQDA